VGNGGPFFLSFLLFFGEEKTKRKKKTLGHYEGGIMEMVVKEAFWGMRYDRNDGIEGVGRGRGGGRKVRFCWLHKERRMER